MAQAPAVKHIQKGCERLFLLQIVALVEADGIEAFPADSQAEGAGAAVRSAIRSVIWSGACTASPV